VRLRARHLNLIHRCQYLGAFCSVARAPRQRGVLRIYGLDLVPAPWCANSATDGISTQWSPRKLPQLYSSFLIAFLPNMEVSRRIYRRASPLLKFLTLPESFSRNPKPAECTRTTPHCVGAVPALLELFPLGAGNGFPLIMMFWPNRPSGWPFLATLLIVIST